MAVGVDYSLFYVRRAREERARAPAPLDAVEIAAATSGRAVVVSGGTVAVAMAGMFLSGSAIFSSLAVGAILVVAVSVLGSITVLPAVLAKLGRWVDRPRVPFLHRLTDAAGAATPRLWPALLRPAAAPPGGDARPRRRRAGPARAAGPRDATELPGTEDLPRSHPGHADLRPADRGVPDQGGIHVVVVQAPRRRKPVQVEPALLGLAGRAAADPRFAGRRRARAGRVGRWPVSRLRARPGHGRVAARRRRRVAEPAAERPDPGHGRRGCPARSPRSPGRSPAVVDYSRLLAAGCRWWSGSCWLLTFLVVVWTFRSVVVAATAIGLNLLSVGAAYGLLVLVFQHSWAEGLLDFRSNGAIVGVAADVPVRGAVRALDGLPRVRGEPDPGGACAGCRPGRRCGEGIVGSAGAVTSAAVVMVAVFAIFGTLSGLEFKQLGVGLAAAMLIDATLVRAVLLPAAMTLLGRWNWWAPALLHRRRPAPEDVPGELVGV